VLVTWALVYLTGWCACLLLSFVAARRFAEADTSLLRSFALSAVAAVVWPVLLIGAAEAGSIAAWSAVHGWRTRDEVPDSWLSGPPEPVYSLN
jgi:hypothetical protein